MATRRCPTTRGPRCLVGGRRPSCRRYGALLVVEGPGRGRGHRTRRRRRLQSPPCAMGRLSWQSCQSPRHLHHRPLRRSGQWHAGVSYPKQRRSYDAHRTVDSSCRQLLPAGTGEGRCTRTTYLGIPVVLAQQSLVTGTRGLRFGGSDGPQLLQRVCLRWCARHCAGVS